jgi:hypothetical protein
LNLFAPREKPGPSICTIYINLFPSIFLFLSAASCYANPYWSLMVTSTVFWYIKLLIH